MRDGEGSVNVHQSTRRVRKFTETLKNQLLEHIAMGYTLASFIWRIRNSPRAMSEAAIHKQLSRDPEFRKRYQFAREFGADMIHDQIIDILSQNRGVKRPSLAIMKN